MVRHSFRTRLLAAVLAGLLTGCAAQKPQPLAPGKEAFPQATGFNQFSIEQEIQLGKQAAAEADAQLPQLPARGTIPDYVSTLGFKLASQLPEEPHWDFSFKVINQKEINAFAMPGGPVRINLGTLQAADNEAQLAGVLAHEIAHVYMRHSTRNASKEMVAQIPAQILGAMLGGGIGGQLARLGLSFGLGSVFMKYSRDAESEADRVGAKIMYDAGYDPHAMVQFFNELKDEDRPGGPQFLSDHPDPGNRAQAVNEAIATLPAKRFERDSPEFGQSKQAAATMKPYTAEQVAQMVQQKKARAAQVAMQQVLPSGQFQLLRHSAFEIAYPTNWEAAGNQNSPVLIAPRGGASESAIAYGVVISGFRSPSGQTSLEAQTQELFNMLQRANPQLRLLGRAQGVSVDGARAYAVNLEGPSPLANESGQPLAERDLLVTAQRSDGSLIWLMFIAPEAQFDRFAPAFQEMLRTLRVG